MADPSGLKKLWSTLEVITDALTEEAARLPEGRYREGIERALGALIPVEWAIARQLGESEPEPAPQRDDDDWPWDQWYASATGQDGQQKRPV